MTREPRQRHCEQRGDGDTAYRHQLFGRNVNERWRPFGRLQSPVEHLFLVWKKNLALVW
jgi:hypothetical protein